MSSKSVATSASATLALFGMLGSCWSKSAVWGSSASVHAEEIVAGHPSADGSSSNENENNILNEIAKTYQVMREQQIHMYLQAFHENGNPPVTLPIYPNAGWLAAFVLVPCIGQNTSMAL